MKLNTVYLLAFLYFAALITFEAAQQHYYLTTFELAGYGEVTLFELMKIHAVRWIIWSLFAIPFGWYVFRHPARHLSPEIILKYGLGLILTLITTLFAISMSVVLTSRESIDGFWAVFSFFVYQKAALFVNAYLGLIILLNLLRHLHLLDSKMVELADLKDEFQSVYDELSHRKKDDHTPIIQIRVGNKVKNILVSDIIWVQSDDYCVKVHTANGSYSLRKSMKRMEQELTPKGFVRLHRSVIVNRDEVDTLVYSQDPQVTLKNGQTLPIASSRVPKVKEEFRGDMGLPA
jgi:hypothetical protein